MPAALLRSIMVPVQAPTGYSTSPTCRAAIEIGPSSTGSQYFSGLIVDNNSFDNFNNDPASGQGTLLPISLVGQASVNSTVTNNFIRRGPINAGVVCVGIEFTGSGEC